MNGGDDDLRTGLGQWLEVHRPKPRVRPRLASPLVVVQRRVYPPQMKVEHRPQELFVFETITCESESYPRADRACSGEEVIIGLGLYDEHWLCHVEIMLSGAIAASLRRMSR